MKGIKGLDNRVNPENLKKRMVPYLVTAELLKVRCKFIFSKEKCSLFFKIHLFIILMHIHYRKEAKFFIIS